MAIGGVRDAMGSLVGFAPPWTATIRPSAAPEPRAVPAALPTERSPDQGPARDQWRPDGNGAGPRLEDPSPVRPQLERLRTDVFEETNRKAAEINDALVTQIRDMFDPDPPRSRIDPNQPGAPDRPSTDMGRGLLDVMA